MATVPTSILVVSNNDTTIGRLVDSETNDVVVNTSVRPVEIANLDAIKTLDIDFSSTVSILSYAGALVRVYYHADAWCISTHNKIDAFTSFWHHAQSFGEMFVTTVGCSVGEFAERAGLNQDMIYTYIIRETVNPHEDRVMFAGAYPKGSDPTPPPPVFDVESGVVAIVPRMYPRTTTELTAMVRVLNKHKIQGMLVFTPNTTYKIYAPGYIHRNVTQSRGRRAPHGVSGLWSSRY